MPLVLNRILRANLSQVARLAQTNRGSMSISPVARQGLLFPTSRFFTTERVTAPKVEYEKSEKDPRLADAQSGGGSNFFAMALAAMGGLFIICPFSWLFIFPRLYGVFNPSPDDVKNGGKTGSSAIADLRQARRSSLKDFKESYYQQDDPKLYARSSYDKFNKNLKLVPETSRNPNVKFQSPESRRQDPRPVGMYDSEGNADETRSMTGNEWTNQAEWLTNKEGPSIPNLAIFGSRL